MVCGVSGLDRGKECIQRCSLPWFGVCWFRVSFCFNEDSGGMGRSGPAVQCARRKKTSAGKAREPGYKHL